MTGSFDSSSIGKAIVTSLAWFPFEDYDAAIELWPSLAEDWADCPHGELVEDDERLRVALAHYRDGLNTGSPFYRFLGFLERT